MFRTVLLASFMFAWGSPQFENLRPEILDVPLVNFHYEVKGVAREAVYVAKEADAIRHAEFMRPYFDFITSRLNG
ncbi:MAG: hypothetical protein ACFB01_04540 [Cohaesibacteraceae bacterium]